ncbi:polysaccharide deacetylase family protein [Enterococcus faecium]|uniref:polysaccharide deacetylase family protein n=1 Tax=Enterococcus faecium TaxID=1352 RepID=UPI0019248BDC|nr:polysaccharide deacetylase family protein [Enterococcus faecium]MBL3708782.1 polysaccharide deacetylase family protein [Enterococcus faecium]
MNRKKLIIYIVTFVNILMLSVVTFSETINMLEKKQEPNTTKSINKNIEVPNVDCSESEQTQKLEKAIAITFDDGPNEITTPKILDILKSKNIQATFFMLGENVSRNKEIVKRIFDSGHEIGNHSFSHRQLTLLSDEEIEREISNTDQEIRKITGVTPSYIRPPYGSVNKIIANIGKRPFIEWSVDSRDWESKNKEAIINEVKNQVYPGSILLFHDIQAATVEALPEVIDYLCSQDYELVTIGQLLQSPKQVINYYGIDDNKKIDE